MPGGPGGGRSERPPPPQPPPHQRPPESPARLQRVQKELVNRQPALPQAAVVTGSRAQVLQVHDVGFRDTAHHS